MTLPTVDAVNLKNRLRNVETDCRDGFHDLAPPNRGSLNSTHIDGTHVPVEEPSTGSGGDITQSPHRRRRKPSAVFVVLNRRTIASRALSLFMSGGSAAG
jgi:hypothetical protein